ncbi:MAG: alpha/beta family hydrolase, partial [Candidatus Binataceae bacterium]
PITLILAHGAGAPMDSPFMHTVAEALGDEHLRVVRFEFSYMAARRENNPRRAPDREPALLEAWRQAVARWGGTPPLIIGGKSLGGRIASMVADELGVAGLVCLGYPFHPPGNPDRTRVKHLEAMRTPALIVQGTRDSFGRPEEVAGYHLSRQIQVAWIEDGDHSLKPRGLGGAKRSRANESASRAPGSGSGRTAAGNLEEAIAHVRTFCEHV